MPDPTGGSWPHETGNNYSNLPQYELRRHSCNKEFALSIWQLPSPATPGLKSPKRIASLQGPPLRMIECRMIKGFARGGIHLGAFADKTSRHWPLDEERALLLGLLFRALAPMRNLDRIRQTADGIEAMSREEAGYWLGMAMYRERPGQVLAALRTLAGAI